MLRPTQTRRFRLSVSDSRSRPRQGEVLLATSTQAEASLLERRLLRAYPEVSEEKFEAAVAEFRRLLAEELAAQRCSNPLQPPRAVLDAGASPRARRQQT